MLFRFRTEMVSPWMVQVNEILKHDRLSYGVYKGHAHTYYLDIHRFHPVFFCDVASGASTGSNPRELLPVNDEKMLSRRLELSPVLLFSSGFSSCNASRVSILFVRGWL